MQVPLLHVIPLPPIVSISLIALVVLITIVLLLRKTSGGSLRRGDTCLLVGLPNSGKTALFFKLKDGEIRTTHTSMIENDATFAVDERNIHIVDLPGHPRVRSRLNHYLPITGCIVFLVDTIDISTNIGRVGEFMYDLLTNSQIVKRRIPILIACNKVDLSIHDMNYVKKNIALELNKLKTTRASQMNMEQEVDKNQIDLVDDVKREFSFDDEEHLRTSIQFVDLSIVQEKNLDIVKKYILENI